MFFLACHVPISKFLWINCNKAFRQSNCNIVFFVLPMRLKAFSVFFIYLFLEQHHQKSTYRSLVSLEVVHQVIPSSNKRLLFGVQHLSSDKKKFFKIRCKRLFSLNCSCRFLHPNYLYQLAL